MKYILAIVDNKFRDLSSILLIKNYIENKESNVKVILANKLNHRRKYDYFMPRVVIVPRFNKKELHYEYYHSNGTKLVILPCEGATRDKEQIIWRTRGCDGDKDMIHRIYLWGDYEYHILKKTRTFKDGVLMVTGLPKWDIYKKI